MKPISSYYFAHCNIKITIDIRTSLADCQIALNLQPQYEKALKRAAQCCYNLERYKPCVTYCDQLLGIDPTNSVIAKLRKDAVFKDVSTITISSIIILSSATMEG